MATSTSTRRAILITLLAFATVSVAAEGTRIKPKSHQPNEQAEKAAAAASSSGSGRANLQDLHIARTAKVGGPGDPASGLPKGKRAAGAATSPASGVTSGKEIEKATNGLKDTLKTQVREAPPASKVPDNAITTKGTKGTRAAAAGYAATGKAAPTGGTRQDAEMPGIAASAAANTLKTRHDTAKNAVNNLR